jgi:hypothetical protein
MRKAMILVPVLMLGGCHMAFGGGSGGHTAKAFQVGTFDKIALAGSSDVEVRTGAAVSVRAEGDQEAIDRLDIRVENGELRIGSRRSSWTFGWSSNHHVKIFVTVPSLAATSIAGSGDVRVDRVAGNRFEGQIAGSGDLNIAQMEVAEAAFSVAGSGDVTVAGKAGKVSFSTAGAGDMRAGALEAGAVNVSIMGSGDVQAHATQSADVNVMGSGDVHIAGTKNCTIHKAGSGTVACG